MACYGLIRGHCVECFVGIDYATLGLEDQESYCLILNDMFDGSCLINVDICVLIYCH